MKSKVMMKDQDNYVESCDVTDFLLGLHDQELGSSQSNSCNIKEMTGT